MFAEEPEMNAILSVRVFHGILNQNRIKDQSGIILFWCSFFTVYDVYQHRTLYVPIFFKYTDISRNLTNCETPHLFNLLGNSKFNIIFIKQ